MIQDFDFTELVEINNKKCSIIEKYAKMRSILERICKDLTAKDKIQFSNLFSRLDYICEIKRMDKRSKFQIHRFRVNANKVLHSKYEPTKEEYSEDMKALCNAISFFYNIEIPITLSSFFPKVTTFKPVQHKVKEEEKRIRRVSVISFDNQYIYVSDKDIPVEEPIKVKHHVSEKNEEFNDTIAKLWKGCQLNLIDVFIDEKGIYNPDIIILEPNYLIDVSSLAECMKDYGKHPLNFVKSKFEAIKNTKHILLGNTANLFLDELINENEKDQNTVSYQNTIKESFKSAPFEFSTCDGIDEQFFIEAQTQFKNIKNVVSNVFPQYNIDKDKAILEPSFICEQLGVQGRLDFLQIEPNKDGKSIVIELKSGKAPFPDTDFSKIGLNNQSQAFIYQIMIQKILGIDFKNLQTYIFYSKYGAPNSNLRLAKPYMSAIKEILNIRNLIVANEYKIAQDRDGVQTKDIIKSIKPETLITDLPLTNKLVSDYIIPQIEEFQFAFKKASELELAYFHSFYDFVTKEHCLSKLGSADNESSKGLSSLWLSNMEEKIEAGEILYDLVISNNQSNTDDLSIQFSIPEYDEDFLPNFRQGDIVILYERNVETDNITNKLIFKGTIQEISPENIIVKLRFKQRNKSILPESSRYAIEHDFLDSSYNAMYRGLYTFLQAKQDRKDLLLNLRVPRQDAVAYCINIADTKEIQGIVHKAVMAKDYFLLVGPPGTGKTSMALKSMVEEFYRDPYNINILLLSYTNRAVDEICDALNNVYEKPDYIRIGSELSCEEKHRERLLDKIISACKTRDEVKKIINNCRIFVGTIASISNKTELFKLKHFQVAIVDEASQILEPHIIGILSAKDVNGANAIDKFILIGDHKQLPAIVLQNNEETKVNDQTLNSIGLKDRRNSLFERLYDLHKNDTLVCGMLHKQGRMHPEIAEFPNDTFYNGQLEPVPIEHQNAELGYLTYQKNNPYHKLIATKRIAFIPSEKYNDDKSNKVNTYEARIVQKIVQHIYELYKENSIRFSPNETIGVITPYRSQIALIRREIHKLDIPELNKITVDTVERFQGAQRDIIIYSFSVNDFYQLDFLSSNSIIEDDKIIDRKLNVAITRARKQFFVTGNPTILWNNLLYCDFIEFIRSKSGYIFATPEDFIAGKFEIEDVVPAIDTDIKFDSGIEGQYIKAIEKLPNPSFPKIIDTIKVHCFQQCPGKNLCLPWLGHNRGKALLTTHQNLCKYLCAYGDIHNKKIKTTLDAILNLTDICKNNYSVIDWGCGQGLATICFFDYLNKKNTQTMPQKVILIEPSEQALSRAKLHTNTYLKNETKICCINKYLDDICVGDIKTNTSITIHFFSNILDIEGIDLKRIAEKITASIQGEQYFVCVEPLCPGCERIDDFAKHFANRQEIAKDTISRLIYVDGWRGVKFLIFKI